MWSHQLSKGRETSKVRQRVKEWISGKGLDLGCGLDKIHPEAIGIDQIPFPGVNFTLDIRDLYILDTNSFDYVFSAHTLEDIEDTEDTLREWWRVLKFQGYLILYLPHRNLYPRIGQPGANPAHKHDFEGIDILKVLDNFAIYKTIVNEVRDQDDEYSFLLIIQKL